MAKPTGILFLLFLTNGVAQVSVQFKTNKAIYLTGEPISVTVDVTNVGTEAIVYSYCDGQIDLTVPRAEKKPHPNLWGCGIAIGGATGCGFDHPPLLRPHEQTSFRYLLRDYRLNPGSYLLQAKGRAGVRWKYYPDLHPNAPPAPSPVHSESDPVEGASFDAVLPITVVAGTPENLEAAYLAYLSEAQSLEVGTAQMQWAREAIAEMAPEFLEKEIARFADPPVRTPDLAVAGLSQIATDESRADLIKLYDNSMDLGLRGQIVEALAGIATDKEISFFSQLLPGRSTPGDDRVREFALLGLGHIGGDAAARALAHSQIPQTSRLRGALVVAFGNTKSRLAVPALIPLYRDQSLRNDVCGSLRELTHYDWCDGSSYDSARWQHWWRVHGEELPLYGNDACPDWKTELPKVQ